MRSVTSVEPALRLFDIQRFCLRDGPGIRTVVFLEGCALRCRWCQNPESLRAAPQLWYHAERCQGCGRCAAVCPNGAMGHGASWIHRDRCVSCGECAAVCPHQAARLVRREESAERVFEQVAADRSYFDASGGGVTLSGGEPLLQPAAALALLTRCKEAGIHTLVQTGGAAPWSAFEQIAPQVDQFYFDLKVADSALHESLTGTGAAPIHDRASRLVRSGAPVRFRMPVIPGHNDSARCLEEMAALLRSLGQRSIHLMRYHRGGEAKLARLSAVGIERPLMGLDGADEALDRAAGTLAKLGLDVSRDDPVRAPDPAAKADSFPGRVWELRRAVQDAPPGVCIERALIVTRYFRDRRNRRKPVAIQRAEALREILRRRRATIYPRELLVGCFSSRRVGGSIFPELHGVAVLEDLLSFGDRRVNPLQIRRRDQLALAARVIPFWLPRFLAVRAFPLPRALRFVLSQLSARQYLINETGGISHFVPDYDTLLHHGARGIAARARRLGLRAAAPDRRDFYRAVEIVCGGLEEMGRAYADCARRQARRLPRGARRDELEEIARTCARVPAMPARTLREAFQSLLLCQIALNQESLDNAVSPGRLDQLLEPYYQADLEAGRIDARGARELVGCFTVKMSEIIPVFSRRITRFHGGLFNGQVVTVGGVDRLGRDATGDMTWMFLDAMGALEMRQPNYHARVHRHSPAPYLDRVAGLLQGGGGSPSVMNDDAVVPMLVARGASVGDARDYSPVGCVEPVVCGKTFGSTDAALVNLPLCLERVLGTARGGAAPAGLRFGGTDAVVAAFAEEVERLVERLLVDLKPIEIANARHHPTPLTSALLQGCLDSGRDASAGGAAYNGSGVQAVGLADVADSLAAMDRVVFQEGRCDLPTLVDALKRDFEGHPHLRGDLLRAPKFGNDDPLVDGLARRVMSIFSDALGRHRNTRGGAYWAGFYSVTAHEAFGEATGALPSGRGAGAPLASGLSPVNGMDRLGPTATLSSVASLDLIRHARNGINLNLKLDRGALVGDEGRAGLSGLLRSYFDRGGMQLQLNVLDPSILIEARDNPELHPGLLVRVSGYSAYFADLSPEMRQEIIDRTTHLARGG